MRIDLDQLMHVRIERLPLLAANWTAERLLDMAKWLQQRKLRRRQRRIDAGNCPNCDYSLRGSIWKCPECGEDIPKAALIKYLLIEGKPAARNFANRSRWRKAVS